MLPNTLAAEGAGTAEKMGTISGGDEIMIVIPTTFVPSKGQKRFPIVSLRYDEWVSVVAAAQSYLETLDDNRTKAADRMIAATQKLMDELSIRK